MAAVELHGVTKRFGNVDVVRGISLHIPDGKFVALVGPSGCGKTTTLRMIAGLEDITDGEIWIGDEVINDVPPKQRDIAMVFQSYALYPHMTVVENMSFGLRLRGIPRDEVRRRVEDAARILEIGDLLQRRPKQLSGGQRQRVAMGRAIVRNPKVFLFDEPLSNLDAKLRVHMRTEIKRIHQQVRTTTVYVTHDQVEAMTLADYVVVMNNGLVEQYGTPQELYHSPQTRFVAGFMGSPAMNFLDGFLAPSGNGVGLELRVGDRIVWTVPADRTRRYADCVDRPVVVGLRPEHITETRNDQREGAAEFSAVIDVVEPMGMETMVFFRLGRTQVCARVEPDSAVAPGETMRLRANLAHLHVIDPTNDKVI